MDITGREDDYEVDASLIFRQDVGDLANATDIVDVFDQYGYHPDDRVERREMCLMYSTCKQDMEREIHNLAHNNQYEKAKQMRARLTQLRKDFDDLQVTKVRTSHVEQVQTFGQAAEEMKVDLHQKGEKMTQDTHEKCEALKEELALFHAIQQENLEFEIGKTSRPRVKYSKRAIELVRAETELIRLAQYDDASKVRRMLQKLLPVEEGTFYDKFDASIADRRIALQKKQKHEWIMLDEKLKGVTWNGVRVREKMRNIGLQRIKNHESDMHHSHKHESKIKPEMSVKPSAHWTKRAGYKETDAALRGDQLLNMVRTGGKVVKPAGSGAPAVFAASLTNRHDFVDHSSLQNTYTL